jgi:trimeric autotransporter adhesin
MAAPGFTPLALYSSTTAAAVPLSANLANGELALNITDGKLYFKDNLGVVTLLADKNSSGGTGTFVNLTATTTFTSNGSATLGNAIGDALTINSGAVSVPNGLNFDSNTLVIDAANNRIGVNVATPTVALDVSGTVKATTGDFTNLTLTGNLTVPGTFAANGGATLGDAIGDALTINSGAVSVPNGLNFDSNTLVIDAANNRIGVGVAAPTVALDVLGSVNSSTDATLNGVTVGRGLGNVATNTAVGASALVTNITGTSNTAVGFGALQLHTTGGGNTAVGFETLRANTNGSVNTAFGYRALYSNTSGVDNIAIGSQALYTSTASNFNIAFGTQALYSNTTGTDNIAIGISTLYSNTTGINNVAIGRETLYSNTTGGGNTAVGYNALRTTTTNFNSTAIGLNALKNSTGGNNTAVGANALTANTTGVNNHAFGTGALPANTTGLGNVGIGGSALLFNTTGSGNTMLNPINSNLSYAPVFDPTTQNNRFCMGSTGVTNAYIQVAWTVVSDARDKTDFAPVPHGLDFVNKLNPIAYRYKDTREATEGHGPVRYGFKAQDVLALEGDNPVIVDAEDSEKLRFNDQSMLAVLVNAINELTAEVNSLKARLPK